MWNLLRTLIIKELRAVLRDPQSRALLFGPVILQAVLFPLAATLEVKNATLAVFDRDGGAQAVELIQRVSRIGAFSHLRMVHDDASLQQLIDEQQALLAVVVPADFSRQVERGRSAPLQAILDGRRSNAAQIAYGYLQRVVDDYGASVTAEVPKSGVVVRHWYNPNLDYRWFIIPSLVAITTTLGALIVTGLSLAREREQGTLDQLLVTPLTPALIMLGKAVPAVLIALFQGTLILLIGTLLYQVPFAGSLLLLYGAMVFYALALVGFGLFISSLSATQQQAFLGVFAFTMPAILLSGYISPVENMPHWLQPITWIDPLRHFIVIVKGLYLKDLGLAGVLANLWPLIVIAVITSSAALFMFRRQTA